MRGLLTIAMLTAAVVCAVPAHADPDGDYLGDLSGQPGIIGGPVNNAVYLAAGHHACDLMGSGVSPEDAAGQLVNFFVTPYVAQTMVASARRTLCR